MALEPHFYTCIENPVVVLYGNGQNKKHSLQTDAQSRSLNWGLGKKLHNIVEDITSEPTSAS